MSSRHARPLSIAMLAPCPFPTRQGTQVAIRHLAAMLARAGHAVHLITFGYGEYDDTFPFCVHRAAKVDAGLRSGPSWRRAAADAALLSTARRVIEAHRCQVLHAHNVEGLGLGALLKLQTRRPLVYHAHTAMGPELPTYFRARFARALAASIGELIDRTLPRSADAVITFDTDHQGLHEGYGIEPERLHVIPPGLAGDEINDPPPPVLQQLRDQLGAGPFVLYAGNPDRYQNLPLLLAAFAAVRAQRPDAQLLLATSYDPAEFASAAGVRSDAAGDDLRIVRYASLDELRALFAIATVGVSPRVLWTGAPIKVLNYLAAGLPTVACRVSARRLVPPSAGFTVDDHPAAFATAVLRLLASPPPRAQVQRAFARFRVEAHLSAYEAVYRGVLGSRAGVRELGGGPQGA